MAVLISHAYSPIARKFATRAELVPGCVCEASAEDRTVHFCPNQGNQWYSIHMVDEIKQLTTFRKNQKDYLVVLLDKEIVIVEVAEKSHPKGVSDRFNVHNVSVPLDNVKGIPESLETEPFLKTYFLHDSHYLLMHRYTDFIMTLNLSSILKDNENLSHKRKKAHDINVSPESFWIGELNVLLLTITLELPTLVLLTRNVDFRYTVRFYSLPLPENCFSLLCIWNIKGIPSHIYSVTDGVVVVSNSEARYITQTKKDIAYNEDKCENLVSSSADGSGATLSLWPLAHIISDCRFNCSVAIDRNRQLLINDRGDTFILYLDVTSSRQNVHVKEFRMIHLGKSSIASSVALLEPNKFLASSSVAPNVHFRILQTLPHIDILKTDTGSLPVLDIKLRSNGLTKEGIIVRGGFHFGELTLLPTTGFIARNSKSVHVHSRVNSFQLSKEGEMLLAHLFQNEVQVQDYIYPEFTPKPGKTDVKKWLSKGTDTIVWNFEGMSIKIRNMNPSFFLFAKSGSDEVIVELEEAAQVSDVTWHNRTNTAFVTLFSGKLGVAYLDSENTSFEWIDLPFTGKSSLACYQVSVYQYAVFVLGINGQLYQQLRFELGETVSNFRAPNLPNAGPYRLTHSCQGSEGPIYIYDEYNVFALSNPDNNPFFTTEKVLETDKAIFNCEALELDNHRLVILFANGVLSDFRIDCEIPEKRYRSNSLIKTAVNVLDKYLVALELSESKTANKSHKEHISKLVLLDWRTLEVLDEYEAPHLDNYVDICLITSSLWTKGDLIVVAANSGAEPEKLLPFFNVKNGKFSGPSFCNVAGVFPKKAQFTKISCYNDNLQLVGTAIVNVVLTRSSDGVLTWEAAHASLRSVYFVGVDTAINSQFSVFADARLGVLISRGSDKPIYNFQLQYVPFFVTSIALLDSRQVLVYGDSIGNIAGVTFGSLERSLEPDAELLGKTLVIFAGNIGGCINVITIAQEKPLRLLVGTSTGKIFRLTEVEDIDEVTHNKSESVVSLVSSWKQPARLALNNDEPTHNFYTPQESYLSDGQKEHLLMKSAVCLFEVKQSL